MFSLDRANEFEGGCEDVLNCACTVERASNKSEWFFFFRRRVEMVMVDVHAIWMFNRKRTRQKKKNTFRMVLVGRVRMVAFSRRERMVAHYIADAPFLLAVMVRRRTFF